MPARSRRRRATTAQDFRRIALSMPDAVEASHMRHPDIRVGGKIFATLGHPDSAWGMVKLSPDQQAAPAATKRAAHRTRPVRR